jgi:hypothetical protein
MAEAAGRFLLAMRGKWIDSEQPENNSARDKALSNLHRGHLEGHRLTHHLPLWRALVLGVRRTLVG